MAKTEYIYYKDKNGFASNTPIYKDGRIRVNKKAKYAEGFRVALHSLNRAMGIEK